MAKNNLNKKYTLPKSAKVAFQGNTFTVYQWPQKMFDGSIKTFERVIQNDAVIVFAGYKGKVVMLRQQQPDTPWYSSLPSGGIEPGEKPAHAGARELLEETGLQAKKMIFWRTGDYRSRLLHRKYFYVAQNCEQVAEQELDNGEKIVVKLSSFQEFINSYEDFMHHSYEIALEMLRAKADKKYAEKLKLALFGPKNTKKTIRPKKKKKSQ